MRYRISIIHAILFISLGLTQLLTASDSTNLVFTYAFLYKSEVDEVKSISKEETSIRVKDGDRIKIFLKPIQNAYIYLFFHDAEGDIHLLFPELISDFEYYSFGRVYYYPQGDEWDTIRIAPDTEKIYLIASINRLKNLEQITNAYIKRYTQTSMSSKETNSARYNLLTEIKKLQLDHTSFPDIKEELVVIAGEFRGENDINFHAIKVSADTCYIKTIRIIYSDREDR